MPKIQLRHDTSTNWTTYNPVLLEGEVAIETDTNKMKIGDGTTAYSSLEYFAGEGGTVDAYTKSETNALLDTKIPTDSVTTPLEYSIISHAQTSVENNSTNFWAKYGTSDFGYGNPSSSAWRNNYSQIITTASGNGIINPDYAILYTGSVSDCEFRWTADNSNTSGYYPLSEGNIVIGNLDNDGKFTPYYYVGGTGGYDGDGGDFFAINPSTVTLQSQDFDSNYVATLFSYADATSLFNIFPYRNQNIWAGRLQITDNNGSPAFAFYGYDTSENQVYTANSNSNPYNVNIEDINCIVAGIRHYEASSTDYNYDLDKWGVYDLQGNKLWSVADTTYTKYLQLNIGAGLAVQNGNLVNTNPTPTDLTNYYNKGEVDNLLDGKADTSDIPDVSNFATKSELNEKQDVLTPDSPIYITSIVRPSNSGMTINSETNRAYSTNQIQMDVVGDTQALCTYLPFTSQDFDYINEHFWDNGYIEVPYNLGQVVCGGSGIEGVIGANLDNFPNLIFGKYVGTNFVPIALYGNNRFYIYYSDTYTFMTGELTTSGTGYLMSLGSNYYGDVPSTRTRISSPEYSRPYGNIGQIYFDPNNSTVTLSFGSNIYLSSETFSNQTVISRLNEVTTVRILPVWDSGNKSTTPLSTLNLGLYNFSTQITTTDLITENSLGTNLFDLQGETAQNYLGINIGSGLAIQSGSLVNTNPTPADLSNYYTKTEIDNMIGNIETTLHNINSGV